MAQWNRGGYLNGRDDAGGYEQRGKAGEESGGLMSSTIH